MRSASAEAIRLYDTSGDGRLDASELASCPAILGVIDRYDIDGDGYVSQQEIADRLEKLYGVHVGVLDVTCYVRHRGRPLVDATIRFIPEPFLGGAIQTATGTTNSDGAAPLSIPTDHLPANIRNVPVAQVGLYRVEIEHPSLTDSDLPPLGHEVDPTNQASSVARFNL